MSDNIEFNLSDSTLEGLRCFVCKLYLSCSPIRILSDGNNICGRCSPLNKEMPAYRQFTLESMMQEALFPCRFTLNGCTMRLSFGCTIEHEVECAYRGDDNSTVPNPGCSWEEPPKDFVKKQPDLVLHDAELRVERNDNDDADRVSVNGPTVVNPYNLRSRSSNPSSLITLRDWNGNPHSFPIPQPNNNWNRDNVNYHERTNYHPPGNWHNMEHQDRRPHFRGVGNRRGYYYRRSRKNNVVVIKGHTLYITL